ncbi:hypothetical protein [Pontibacter sp. SGAir0037]|uniref:hypothetical protein n=1 Tax=Pontibacter sp. SGAir0037 TaxID=2571030 RepID=UPI0010CD620A|nr:hypothetical protein [Pontibacter sp. SGAir0037]QCR21784.1 hypothetical protein C1N53_05110 [Pontibacter sp. SGAir0037]
MLHFSRISSQGNDFHLIASGALAFKIQNKILKDDTFQQGVSVKRNLIWHSSPARTAVQKKVFFVIISDLDKVKVESLCKMIADERAQGGYAVCQVIPMLLNEPGYKALKMLRQSFDEVIELNKFNMGNGAAAMSAEQQQCIMTDYSISMARIIFHSSMNKAKVISPQPDLQPVPMYA